LSTTLIIFFFHISTKEMKRTLLNSAERAQNETFSAFFCWFHGNFQDFRELGIPIHTEMGKQIKQYHNDAKNRMGKATQKLNLSLLRPTEN
jgi:hypothetical protein